MRRAPLPCPDCRPELRASGVTMTTTETVTRTFLPAADGRRLVGDALVYA